MKSALDGVRIIDFTVIINGPMATAMLGDMGAEVIKIEDIPTGEPARALYHSGLPQTQTINYLVELQSRNKKSVGLDLRREGASNVVHRLAANADAFVSNLRMDSLRRWKLDYETLSQINPSLVYAHGGGYGDEGPDAALPAQDYSVMARSGLMSVLGEPGEPPPPMGMAAVSDHSGAVMLAYGIMLGLFHRERTGEGQMVCTSLLGATAVLQALSLQAYLVTGESPQKLSRKRMPNPLRNWYQTSDDRWLCLGMGWSDRFYPVLCEALGRPELAKDPRFDGAALRSQNSADLVAILDEIFATKPLDEWMRILRENRLPSSPVNNYAEVAVDPQMLSNRYVIEVDHPTQGRIKELGFPVNMSKTPGSVRTTAPEIGEHTEEVLVEVGGYNWDEIVDLKRRKIIL